MKNSIMLMCFSLEQIWKEPEKITSTRNTWGCTHQSTGFSSLDFVKVSDLWSYSVSKNWTVCKLKTRSQSSRMFRIHSQIKKQILLYRVSSMSPFFSLVCFSPLYLLRRNDSAPYREYSRKTEFVFRLLVTWSITFMGDWS